MPVYKDKDAGTWFVKFYYTDYTGVKKQKMKRGFTRRRDAQAWEAEFLAKLAPDPEMPFSRLQELYLEDLKTNRKETTYRTRENRIKLWIQPYFNSQPVSSITPADVRKWQNDLRSATGKKGKPLSLAYVNNLVEQLSTIFNYAVRFYGLRQNPVRIAGNPGSRKKRSLNFWTPEEYQRFIQTFHLDDWRRVMYDVLYYTGIRSGELLALTPADLDLDAGELHINRTYHVIDGKDVLTAPKTPKSVRTVTLPKFLTEELRGHMKRLYGLRKHDRIFPLHDVYIRTLFRQKIRKAGLREIRLHDLRHSHASLLIDLGFSELLVAERLGHESVSTTLDIYSHLFPSKQSEVADRLERFRNDTKMILSESKNKKEDGKTALK